MRSTLEKKAKEGHIRKTRWSLGNRILAIMSGNIPSEEITDNLSLSDTTREIATSEFGGWGNCVKELIFGFGLSCLDMYFDFMVSKSLWWGETYRRYSTSTPKDKLNCTLLASVNETNRETVGIYSCFETDPIWAVWIWAFFILPGVFTWINKFLNQCREAKKKRKHWQILLYFFLYLFLVVTYPLQFISVKLLSLCYKGQVFS